eukprot:GFYU01015018.1.p1 GENE.GFYU01015018.1~~GFYU01015018.1.p1  ORF type:complete len:110 (-),score=27.76 GFYU01015018.1:428-757(-)
MSDSRRSSGLASKEPKEADFYDDDDELESKIKFARGLIRILGGVSGAGTTISAGYSLANDVQCGALGYIICLYLITFGVVITMAELRIKMLRHFATFLAFRTGRGMFMI